MKNNQKPEELFPQVSNELILRNLSLWFTIAMQRGVVLDYEEKINPPTVDTDHVHLPCKDSE